MKNIFIVIFTAIFVGVFALNINYQLKPVDNVWGLSDAVADGSNTSSGSGGWLKNLISDVVSYYNKKIYTCESRGCSATVYRKVGAAVGASWQIESQLLGIDLSFGYEHKSVAGERQQAVSGTSYAHKSECETECVPGVTKA